MSLIRFIMRGMGLSPAAILLAVVIGLFSYVYETLFARPGMAYMGVPQAIDWKQALTWTHIIRNQAFMLGYSELRGNPLWVTYHLTPPQTDSPHWPRPHRFTQDWRSLTRIDHEDYQNSGYDRGHLAPNHAISVVYGREAQLETFLMTNISPQKPELNQKLWERLEEVELDRLARNFESVWVTTGPLFDSQVERLKSAYRVEIPDAFYKIYAIPNSDSNKTRLLAFMMPQTVHGNEPLDQYLTTVDEIERQTGLDFFADMEDSVENRLENSVDIQGWQMETWARLKGRYSNKKQTLTRTKKTEPRH
ncbi:MAG: DNA/RNA non-specific endonuclease [Methylococcaceae bacterium]